MAREASWGVCPYVEVSSFTTVLMTLLEDRDVRDISTCNAHIFFQVCIIKLLRRINFPPLTEIIETIFKFIVLNILSKLHTIAFLYQ